MSDGYTCGCTYTDQKTLKTCQCERPVSSFGEKCKQCQNGCHPLG